MAKEPVDYGEMMGEIGKLLIAYRSKAPEVLAGIVIAAAIAGVGFGVLNASRPSLDAYEANLRSQTLMLSIPDANAGHATYAMPSADLYVSHVTWRFPLDYAVTRAWVQIDRSDGAQSGPHILTVPDMSGDVTAWLLPATLFPGGPVAGVAYTFTFSLEVTDGIRYRMPRLTFQPWVPLE